MTNIVHNGIDYVTLNWAPSRPDPRDFHASDHLMLAAPQALPSRVSLAQFSHAILDQAAEGSCTAHGTLNAIYNLAKRLGIALPELSRQAQYNWSRMLEGTLSQDAGAYIRDAVKVPATTGMALESLFAYGPQNMTITPPQNVILDAAGRKILKYVSVPNDGYTIKATIAAGYPVIIGFSVAANMMTADVARTGLIPMPQGSIVGGHSIEADTYDDSTSLIEGPNSWGVNWGCKVDGSPGNGAGGRYRMPYGFLQMMGADFWAVTDLAGNVPPPPPPVTKTYEQGLSDMKARALIAVSAL